MEENNSVSEGAACEIIDGKKNCEIEQNPQEEKPFIKGNFLKSLIFAFVSLAIVVGNFFLENSLAAKGEAIEQKFSSFDYRKDNEIDENTIIRFSDEEAYKNPSMKVVSREGDYNILKLESGRFWANFANSTKKTNILLQNVLLIPDHASFDLAFDKAKIKLSVYDGDVYIGFLPKDFKMTQYQDPYSKLFLNRLLIARNNQVQISLSKVNDSLKPLLNTKLSKEFKYSLVAGSAKEEQFIKENLQKDAQFWENKKKQFLAEVIAQGAFNDGSFVAKFISWSERNLTFLPEKKQKLLLENLFNDIDDALFYAASGNQFEIAASLERFSNKFFALPASFIDEHYYEVLDSYIADLSLFNPDENQYQIFQFLLDKKIVQNPDSLKDAIGLMWFDVYRGINVGKIQAEKTLNDFYKYFAKTLENAENLEMSRMYLTYYNQLFDNLLINYPVFYKDGYFVLKSELESKLLATYENGQLREELRQAFISKKIDFLKRLRKFFFDGELEIVETKEIFSRLFEEIEDLMPEEKSTLAVIELFESQLSDMDDFFGYLSSPEYQKLSYGPTHEDRYKVYLEERETIFNFINLQQELSDGEVIEKEVVVSDVADEIKQSFAQNSDISGLEIGKIDDVNQRNVDIKAIMGGYPFSASYDRDTKLVKDIYVYEELVSDRGVPLQGLLKVLQSKFADKPQGEEVKATDEEITLESAAQRTARFYVSNRVSDSGFVSELENVIIVDELKSIYHLEDLKIKDYEDSVVSFDLDMNGEKASNVMMKVGDNERVLEGQILLDELVIKLLAEREFVLNATKTEEEKEIVR